MAAIRIIKEADTKRPSWTGHPQAVVSFAGQNFSLYQQKRAQKTLSLFSKHNAAFAEQDHRVPVYARFKDALCVDLSRRGPAP